MVYLLHRKLYFFSESETDSSDSDSSDFSVDADMVSDTSDGFDMSD